MASNDKLYEIYKKYNLKENKLVLENTKKPKNMFETFQTYKIPKYNFVHHVGKKLNIISEAVFGNIYKGTVYLSQDDIKFLKQFDPYYWKQALFMRYDKYLFNYLMRLDKIRKTVYNDIFKSALEHELTVIDSDPVYISSGKSAEALAKLHAKNIAKQYVDRQYNVNTVPPEADNSMQPFDLRERGSHGYRFFAKPYIKELVQRLEGTIGVHDGFDLHNPKLLNIKTKTASGEDQISEKKTTDGFVFPSMDAIRDMIEDYLRLLGNQIVKYDPEDLKYKPNHPEKDPSEIEERDATYKSFEGKGGRKIVDSMAYELTKDFLINSERQRLVGYYRSMNQEKNTQELEREAKQKAEEKLNKLIENGNLKTGKREIKFPDPANPGNEIVIRPEDLPTGERGLITKSKDIVKAGPRKGESKEALVHPKLYLLQQVNYVQRQKIRFGRDGEVIPESETEKEIVPIEMPVLKPGHSYRRLNRTEIDLLNKLSEVDNDVSKLTPAEKNIYYTTFAGNPSAVLRGEHMDIENAEHPDEKKKFRSLYIQSEHLPDANKQGSGHSRAGGFFPNAESPERQYLRKYDLRFTDEAIEKYENENYSKKIDKLFGPDGLGRDLRGIIKEYIENRLSSSEMQETFNLRVERSVLMMFLPQLVEMGIQKVFENLDKTNIETDPSVTKKLLNVMLQSIEEQDFGRGSRRRRQSAVAVSPTELTDLFSFTRAIKCGPGIRRMETGTCQFVYRLDKLEDLANDSSKNIKDLQGSIIDDSASLAEKEASMGEIISNFQFAMHDLALAYYAKEFYDNPNLSWDEEPTKQKYAEKAQTEADKFVEGVLNSLTSTQTERGSAVKAGMAIEMIKSEIESTLKSTQMPSEINPLVIRADREIEEDPINYEAIIKKYKDKQVPQTLLDFLVSNARKTKSIIANKQGLLNQIINKTMMPNLIFGINVKYLPKESLGQMVNFLDENLREKTPFGTSQKDRIMGLVLKVRKELESRNQKGITI